MVTLQELFTKTLAEAGFYDILLPWLLFFSLVFGLLMKLKLFGELKEARQLNLIIAVVIAFFIVNFVPGAGLTFGVFLRTLFGQGAIVLAGILLALLFITMTISVPGEKFKVTGKMATFIGSAMVIIAIIIFFASGIGAAIGLTLGIPEVRPGAIGMDVLMTILMIGVIMIAIIAIGRAPKEKPGEAAGPPAAAG